MMLCCVLELWEHHLQAFVESQMQAFMGARKNLVWRVQ
ncbi:hypothetical protein LINPERHAP1_LOCUS38809 [Linum perenne]